MIIFEVLFSHIDGEKRTVTIKPNDNDLGFCWAKELKENIDRGGVVREPNRIYNLSNIWTEEKIVVELQECSKVIKEWVPGYIDFDYSKQIDQRRLNILHKYFENIRRKDNDLFKNAPWNVQHAINEYNNLIHRLESFKWEGQPRIVVSMTDRKEYELEDEHYEQFTMSFNPGDVCLNYTHIGKTLWDVFKDGDEITGQDNILPQHTYSGDFHIRLAKGSGISQPFQEWLNRNEDSMPQEESKRSLGLARVGRIVNNQTTETLWGILFITSVRYYYGE